MNIIKQSLGYSYKSRRINLAGLNPLFISRRNDGAYEGYGKTTVHVMNGDEAKVQLISATSQRGFRLMDTSFVAGPMIIYRNYVYCWNIAGDEQINEESLEFFFHLVPRLDLLIIGYSHADYRKNLDQTIPITCRRHGLHVEILPTIKAVTTYNFLAPIRTVAGAFVPPAKYNFDLTDFMGHKERLGIEQGRDPDEPERIPLRYPNPEK